MYKYFALIFCFAINGVFASLPIQVSDEELIRKTDHILVGRVIGVDMIDENGTQITGPNSSTGPGIKSKIRLIISVDEVILSNIKVVPKILYVPLDNFMHYSLGSIKAYYPEITEQRLILLYGNNFQPPIAGHFQRNLSEKDYFLNLYKTNK